MEDIMSGILASACSCATGCVKIVAQYALTKSGVVKYASYNSPQTFGYVSVGAGVATLAYSFFRLRQNKNSEQGKSHEETTLLELTDIKDNHDHTSKNEKRRTLTCEHALIAAVGAIQVAAGFLFILTEIDGNGIVCNLSTWVTKSWDTCMAQCTTS